MLDSTLFRAYDIRGVADETLTREAMRAIGYAFAQTAAAEHAVDMPHIAVARDGRMSSPSLSEALIAGLRLGGAEVTNYGLGPTPMLYFAAHTRAHHGGMMITGSHNPPNHNGCKMVMGKRPFFGDDITALGGAANAFLASDKNTNNAENASLPVLHSYDIKQAYLAELLAAFHTKDARKLTIVWDAGNGAAGEMTEKLVAALPGTHHTLFTEIDGTFPNHHPDPTVEKNLEALVAKVAEEDADCGVAFDGDGDRIGVVDAKGRIMWGDQLLPILAGPVLRNHPSATIIADVKASQHCFDAIEKLGGTPLMWKTGHSLIKAKMLETDAPLAGEMSGHIFFADTYYGFDDALYAAVRLLDILAHSTLSLTARKDAMPKNFSTPELRLEIAEADKFAFMQRLLARANEIEGEVNNTDGIRVNTPLGWWLVRASNTQAAIIVRVETSSEANLHLLCERVIGIVEPLGLACGAIREALQSGEPPMDEV